MTRYILVRAHGDQVSPDSHSWPPRWPATCLSGNHHNRPGLRYPRENTFPRCNINKIPCCVKFSFFADSILNVDGNCNIWLVRNFSMAMKLHRYYIVVAGCSLSLSDTTIEACNGTPVLLTHPALFSLFTVLHISDYAKAVKHSTTDTILHHNDFHSPALGR